jgi:hypothetical protein
MKASIYDYIEPIKTGDDVVIGYIVFRNKTYYSPRYKKRIEIKTSDKPYDGATGAIDIDSFGWLFHDVLCRDGCFSDGTACNNWQASMVLSDILAEEGRWFRAKTWLVATWLLGGGKARKNGMF